MMEKTNCGSFDLTAYQFGEAAPADKRAIEAHVRTCEACASELERLNFTQAALLSGVRDEEMPRRIAFVSDKVFEPKWYQRLWSTPQWGFASSGLLAAAIVFHATRPKFHQANYLSKMDFLGAFALTSELQMQRNAGLQE